MLDAIEEILTFTDFLSCRDPESIDEHERRQEALACADSLTFRDGEDAEGHETKPVVRETPAIESNEQRIIREEALLFAEFLTCQSPEAYETESLVRESSIVQPKEDRISRDVGLAEKPFKTAKTQRNNNRVMIVVYKKKDPEGISKPIMHTE